MTERKAVVTVCADGSCAPSADAATGNVVLKPNMTDQQLKAALKPVETFPVLHLKDVWNSWGGFESAALQAEFTEDIASASILLLKRLRAARSSAHCASTGAEGVEIDDELTGAPTPRTRCAPQRSSARGAASRPTRTGSGRRWRCEGATSHTRRRLRGGRSRAARRGLAAGSACLRPPGTPR